VTLSVAIRRGDRTLVVGADLDWRRISDATPTRLP
jgi:hypothetical protein